MCLEISNNAKEQYATEDIVCYKVIKRYERFGSDPYDNMIIIGYFYNTPFQDARVEIGKTYRSQLRKVVNTTHKIEEGIHSCVSYEDAQKTCRLLGTLSYYAIAKCIIPKGSKFYVGYFGPSNVVHRDNEHNITILNSYASNKLKYVEIVKTQC